MRGKPGNSGRDISISGQGRKQGASQRMLDTAALGTAGFIAIDPHSLKSTGTTMLGLAAEACDVFASRKIAPRAVTPCRDPSAGRNSLGLLVYFGKEAELDRAIGPYTILGIKTQLVRFCVEEESSAYSEQG